MADKVSESLARVEQLLGAGRFDEMRPICQSLLEAGPNAVRAEAHRFLGLAAFVGNRLPEAEAHARRAVELAPNSAVAYDNLGLYLLRLGRPDEAERAARQAMMLEPTLAAAAHNLGLALRRLGRLAEAEIALRQAQVLKPRNPDLWNDLAAVLEAQHRPVEAIVALELALEKRPQFPLAKANLQRLRALVSPAAITPGSAAAANNRGVELLAQRRHAEAESVFRQALLLAPDLPEVSFNLAKALEGQQRLTQAEDFFLRALRQRPQWVEAHFHLGFLYFSQRRLSDAEAEYRRTLELAPTFVEGLNSLAANVLNNQGRIDEARAVYQQALSLAPQHASCHSNMLLNEQYSPGQTLASLARVHADWEHKHVIGSGGGEGEKRGRGEREKGRKSDVEIENALKLSVSPSPILPFSPSPPPSSPLRLGLVSGDLFYHPVGIFLAPILERLGRKQWVTICYANQRKEDDMTRRLMRAAAQWRVVHDLSDEALATQIRADGIDLLFDLSGHTGGNRLLTFARKPARVQLTWMGYVGTTGLAAIDYLIADRFHVPPSSEQHYREKILRLPDSYLCYEPPIYAPPVGPLPASTTGQVTFGCFNNTAKISPAVVAVWAEILRQVPGSRLILKYHWLDDAGLRPRLRRLFAAEGVGSEDRLELLGSTSHAVQLDHYNRVDIALDTFPYSGGLTTCEACWMGAPVITCPGETFASRHSLSYLSNIALTETIATDKHDYVARAVCLARDLTRLADLRSRLRQRMARAPLCNLDLYVEQFTAAIGACGFSGREDTAFATRSIL